MIDVDDARVDARARRDRGGLDRLVKKEKLSAADRDAALERLRGSTDYRALREVRLHHRSGDRERGAEARHPAARSTAVAKDDAIARDQHVVDLDHAARRGDVTRPHGFVGMHFFNPVPLMALVEVMRGPQTGRATVERASAFAKRLGKTPIVVKDSPGFVVNRMLCPMLNEAVFTLREGIATAQDIDEAMKLGCNHPIGPLALCDLIGLDVLLAVMKVFYARLQRSEIPAGAAAEGDGRRRPPRPQVGSRLLHLSRKIDAMTKPARQLSQTHDISGEGRAGAADPHEIGIRALRRTGASRHGIRRPPDRRRIRCCLAWPASAAPVRRRFRAALDPLLGHAAPAREQLPRARAQRVAAGSALRLRNDHGRALAQAAGQLRVAAHRAAEGRDGRCQAPALRDHRPARRSRARHRRLQGRFAGRRRAARRASGVLRRSSSRIPNPGRRCSTCARPSASSCTTFARFTRTRRSRRSSATARQAGPR